MGGCFGNIMMGGQVRGGRLMIYASRWKLGGGGARSGNKGSDIRRDEKSKTAG